MLMSLLRWLQSPLQDELRGGPGVFIRYLFAHIPALIRFFATMKMQFFLC